MSVKNVWARWQENLFHEDKYKYELKVKKI